jgi:hypothetical protein
MPYNHFHSILLLFALSLSHKAAVATSSLCQTCYFDSVDVIQDAGALKEDCSSLTLASVDKCFYFWLESFLIQSHYHPGPSPVSSSTLLPLRGADYLFLSSKMQSVLTSSPTHQGTSGLKQHEYFRHTVQPETETEKRLLTSFNPRSCKAW